MMKGFNELVILAYGKQFQQESVRKKALQWFGRVTRTDDEMKMNLITGTLPEGGRGTPILESA